jgi:hypothetical protein
MTCSGQTLVSFFNRDLQVLVEVFADRLRLRATFRLLSLCHLDPMHCRFGRLNATHLGNKRFRCDQMVEVGMPVCDRSGFSSFSPVPRFVLVLDSRYQGAPLMMEIYQTGSRDVKHSSRPCNGVCPH